MENAEPLPGTSAESRGRVRGKSRGGLGKYLRARGRGRGRGRGAVWGEKLVLEHEREVEVDEEEVKELQQKYGRRQLGTNADRYAEPDAELDSDGEPIIEPEIDLSTFLARQKLADDLPSAPDEDEDVDTSIPLHPTISGITKKGKVQQIEWDQSLEDLRRENAAADATRDLKARFRTHSAIEKLNMGASKQISSSQRDKRYVQAPALPTGAPPPNKSVKQGMEDFLDDLLN